MTSNRLSNWISIAANVGVLIGVVFVAFEIRQNTAISRAAVNQSHNDAYRAFRAHVINDADVARIWLAGRRGRPLSEVDQYRFTELVYDRMVPAYTTFVQARAVDDPAAAERIAQIFSPILTCPGVRQVWDDSPFGQESAPESVDAFRRAVLEGLEMNTFGALCGAGD
ncbi:MAG: hypothetical protein AAGG11_15930 [Pseudomonadota bacterium]